MKGSETTPTQGARRTIAVGAITVRATAAGVTGAITPPPPAALGLAVRREGHAPAAPAPAVTA
ncbi:hypothetical protein [Streptomyces sp. Inha503]|uniref:hypothetical protein n=1 Tax=Streptomyces sp. Inha503 TaxID=3383314 RepID=UPI0039A3006C